VRSVIPFLADREFDSAFLDDLPEIDYFSIDRLREEVAEQSYMALLLTKACGLEVPNADAA
jgi:hypothetical protein